MYSETLAITIECPPQQVYRYLQDAGNMPKWAFCTSMRSAGENRWIMGTAEGEFPVRFAPANEFLIVDHYVTVAPDSVVYVPMRVLENGQGGSEVIFTLFRQPAMSDADFARDRGMVEKDLANLKRVLEEG